jgi:hypothetical protein
MSRTITLAQVRVASPCPQSWESMTGDAKVRFCDRCELRVFNLSEMTRDEAQSVLDDHPDRLCVCYRPTAIGGVQTLDYQPQKARRPLRWWLSLGAVGAIAATVVEAIVFFGRPKPAPMVVGDMMIRGKVAPPAAINQPTPP